MRTSVFSAIVLFATTEAASAQSFSCDDAKLDAELAICSSEDLSSLDEEMSITYYSLPQSVRNSQELRSERESFLRRRDRCGYNEGCIESAYEGFIGYLDNF